MASTAPTAPLADGLDTFPKLLLHNAANWPDAVAMREKDSRHLERLRLGRLPRPGAGDRARPAEPRLPPRRGGLPDRPQPAELGLVRAGRAGGRRDVARRLRGRAGRGGRLPHRPRRGDRRPRRGRGAGRQAARAEGPHPDGPPHRLPRPAWHAEVRRPAAGRLGRAGPPWCRAGRSRARALRGRGGAGPGRGRRDPVHDLRHDGAPQARQAAAPALPRAPGRLPRRRPARSRGRVRVPPAAALDHGAGLRRRHAAALPHPGQLPGECRDRDGGSARDRADPPPPRAARLGADRGRRAGAGHGREPADPAPLRLGRADGRAGAGGRPPLARGRAAAARHPARPARPLARQVGRHRRGLARARHLQVLPRHGRAAAPALRPDRAVGRLHDPGRARDRPRQLGGTLSRHRDPHRIPRRERARRDRHPLRWHVRRLPRQRGRDPR